MVDATKRKLTLPAWHIPYLEKHRIIELYREIVRELVIQQPVDHVLFIKQILMNALNASKVARVVILCSPKVNCIEVAKRIALVTQQKVITEEDILHSLGIKNRHKLKPAQLALALSQMTRTDGAYKSGWIIVDVIKSGKEAKKMLEAGVLPTHVLHLIPAFNPPLTELLYCNVISEWPEYRRVIMDIREAFKNRLVEVFLGNGLIQDVVAKCVDLINIRDGYGGPIKPRVLILGPRGSGRKTQAKLLEATMGLVHIDFEYLLCQAWLSDSDLGERLRACRDEVCYRSDLLCEVANKRFLEPDCLDKGWVLTCFPFTDTDFKHLDTLDTPPNRVIFLECDPTVCRERLINRRINAHTGSTTDVVEQPNSLWYKHLNTHPKDKIAMINAEIGYFCEQYGSLRTYCGGTATVINADQLKRWVYESIAATIVRGSPTAPARDPCFDIKEKIKQDYVTPEQTDSTVPTQLFNSFITGEQTHDESKKDGVAFDD